MNKHHQKLFPIVCLIILTYLSQASLSSAETRYVSDKLVISVRSGPGPDYKVLETIKTGTSLKVLEENNDYIKISTEEGLTGWVSKYYTETEIPKTRIIESLNLEIQRMEKEAEEQASQITELQRLQEGKDQNAPEIDKLASELSEIKEKHALLLAQSGNIIETIKERDDLKKEAYGKDQKLRELSDENSNLRNYKMLYWFATGGGIFLLGWLIGKFSRKNNKRSLSL